MAGLELRGLENSAMKFAPPQERESSDNPILNAFCRVAPSVRFKVLAILSAGVFFRASDFNSRTWTAVQATLFDAFFTISDLLFVKGSAYTWKSF